MNEENRIRRGKELSKYVFSGKFSFGSITRGLWRINYIAELSTLYTHWKLVHLQWNSFLLISLIIFLFLIGEKYLSSIYLVKGLYILAFLEFWHNLFVDTLFFVKKGKIFFYCFRLPYFYIFKNIRYLHSFSSKSIKSYLIVYNNLSIENDIARSLSCEEMIKDMWRQKKKRKYIGLLGN